jgi:hypothetical protein
MLRSFQNISLCLAFRAPQRASPVLESCRAPLYSLIMAKRKRSAIAAATEGPDLDRSRTRHTEVPLPPDIATNAPKPARRQSSRGDKSVPTNPDTNPDVLDGVLALRASPDGHEDGEPESHLAPNMSNGTVVGAANDTPATKNKRKKVSVPQVKVEPEESKAINGIAKSKPVSTKNTLMEDDPEAEEELEEDEVEVKEALSRSPPVNSEYLPLPWKGRLGYVCTTHSPYNILISNECTGLPQHVSPQCKSSGIQLQDMPYRKHNRASPPAERPISTRACHKKPPGQGTAGRCRQRYEVCRRTRSCQRA